MILLRTSSLHPAERQFWAEPSQSALPGGGSGAARGWSPRAKGGGRVLLAGEGVPGAVAGVVLVQ